MRIPITNVSGSCYFQCPVNRLTVVHDRPRMTCSLSGPDRHQTVLPTNAVGPHHAQVMDNPNPAIRYPDDISDVEEASP
jgi:hypothetical protein